jgi:hypothetical protein
MGLQKNKFHFLLINLVKTDEFKSIFDFVQKRIAVRPHDPVRILETLFKLEMSIAAGKLPLPHRDGL